MILVYIDIPLHKLNNRFGILFDVGDLLNC